MTVFFVTGTDTEVGKTMVDGGPRRDLTSAGRSVAVVKPAQTGVGPDEPGDVDEVRRLAGELDVAEGVRPPLSHLTPLPLSPESSCPASATSVT